MCTITHPGFGPCTMNAGHEGCHISDSGQAWSTRDEQDAAKAAEAASVNKVPTPKRLRSQDDIAAARAAKAAQVDAAAAAAANAAAPAGPAAPKRPAPQGDGK